VTSKYGRYICSKLRLNHTHVLFAASCSIKWYVFTCYRFLYLAFFVALSCGRDIIVGYKKWISWFTHADGLTKHMLRYSYIPINMLRYGTFYFYINVCISEFVFRFMEIVIDGCLDMMKLYACCLFLCNLKRTLPVPDILSISIQIPYYTNVRKLCRYYNMFESIRFVIYHVKFILLSS
jgi:hypothetical protein